MTGCQSSKSTELQKGKRSSLALLITCISLFFTTPALAQQPDAYQPLSISAQDAEVDVQNGWAKYSGDVELKQGSLIIRCESLQIFKSTSGIDKIIAEGTPAQYSQSIQKLATSKSSQEETLQAQEETLQAQAETLTYQLGSRSIELLGQAKIQQGENIFEGHSILYEIDNRKIIARSNKQLKSGEEQAGSPQQRVKIVLPVRQPEPTE